jgi:hypothetical protein
MRMRAQELPDAIQESYVRRHERLGEQCCRLRIELSLIAISAEQGAIEQEESAQQHEKHRADKAREQAEPHVLARSTPDSLTAFSRSANVCHAYA